MVRNIYTKSLVINYKSKKDKKSKAPLNTGQQNLEINIKEE